MRGFLFAGAFFGSAPGFARLRHHVLSPVRGAPPLVPPPRTNLLGLSRGFSCSDYFCDAHDSVNLGGRSGIVSPWTGSQTIEPDPGSMAAGRSHRLRALDEPFTKGLGESVWNDAFRISEDYR